MIFHGELEFRGFVNLFFEKRRIRKRTHVRAEPSRFFVVFSVLFFWRFIDRQRSYRAEILTQDRYRRRRYFLRRMLGLNLLN